MNVENHSSKAFISKFTKELFILERSHTLVTNAKNHSAHLLTLEAIQFSYILKSGHFHATNVKSLSNLNHIWRSTRSVVMLKRTQTMWPRFLMTEIQFTNFLARIVGNVSQQNGHWFSTKGRTLAKSNFHVTSVRNPLQWDAISKITKEGILRKGLFLVIRVTRHLKPVLTCIITSGKQSKVSGMLNVCEIATVFKIYKVYEIYKVAKLRKVGYSYTTENTPSKIHTFEKYIFDKYSLNKSKSDVSKNTSLRECYLKSRYFSVRRTGFGFGSRPLPKSHKAMDICHFVVFESPL